MNCNGQPITPETAEQIELMNKWLAANKTYVEMYLAMAQLWTPWWYTYLKQAQKNQNAVVTD